METGATRSLVKRSTYRGSEARRVPVSLDPRKGIAPRSCSRPAASWQTICKRRDHPARIIERSRAAIVAVCPPWVCASVRDNRAKETIDGRRQLPSTGQSPGLPDGRHDRLRPDPGRLLPAAGPRRAEELRLRSRPRPESVIHIFLPGGIAHQETFDPKPFAPIEYRGEMGVDPDQDRRRAVFSETPAARPPRSPTRSRSSAR